MALLELGYLETDYLDYDYLVEVAAESQGFQATIIIDDDVSKGFQSFVNVFEEDAKGFEGDITINDDVAKGFQSQAVIDETRDQGWQAQAVINADSDIAFEADVTINKETAKGFQAQGIINEEKIQGWQATIVIDKSTAKGFEAAATPHQTQQCDYYLYAEDYLTGDYLAGRICVDIGFQAQIVIAEDTSRAFEAEAVIDKSVGKGFQTQAIIDKSVAQGWQTTVVQVKNVGWQSTVVLYNTVNLRILDEFPSRGVGSGNWTATSTAAGDYAIENVDTDIVEQIWRSATGVKVVNLDCDTGIPQGIFLDTLAILNHNFTRSATVTLIGSNNSGHSPAGVTIPLVTETENMYYIAPELPLTGYRYWRINIDDTSNTDNFVSVGTIVFGAAKILATNNMVDRIRFGRKHFSDSVFTEGHTNVANDRGLKKFLNLEFRNLNISSGDYQNLTDVFTTARTNLKCLWIPTPQYPSRYAVFAKLTELPDEEHRDLGEDADYVSLSVSLDESK